jgi:hypothetical protein
MGVSQLMSTAFTCAASFCQRSSLLAGASAAAEPPNNDICGTDAIDDDDAAGRRTLCGSGDEDVVARHEPPHGVLEREACVPDATLLRAAPHRQLRVVDREP